MNNSREGLKSKIIDVIRDVASEELKVPRESIVAGTELPLESGMRVAMRIANAIPGGGIINVTPTSDKILCTIDELAEKCTDEMFQLINRYRG